jgi:Cytochrome c/c1 heme lyase
MKETADVTDVSGTCPVRNDNNVVPTSNDNVASYWKSLFSVSNVTTAATGAAVAVDVTDTSTGTSTCPVSKIGDVNVVPASIEEEARYAQTPQPDQTIPLAIERQVSSIPRGGSDIKTNIGLGQEQQATTAPNHQFIVNSSPNKDGEQNSDEKQKWVYPSEQQMFNAMRKKGYMNVPVLKIHNHINESTWHQIQEWENTTTALQLVRFQGKPKEMSPKAYLFSTILRLRDPPFDRHDWYVRNSTTNTSTNILGGGSHRIQRYVIDYYYLPQTNPNMPPIPYIDARPALDHPYALYLHGRRFLQLTFPGIASFFKKEP